MTIQEHIKWCKQRALEYVNNGDVTNAYLSMASDIAKHRDIDMEVYKPVLMLGMAEVMNGDVDGMRKWIEGF